jgi:hypothetical protein
VSCAATSWELAFVLGLLFLSILVLRSANLALVTSFLASNLAFLDPDFLREKASLKNLEIGGGIVGNSVLLALPLSNEALVVPRGQTTIEFGDEPGIWGGSACWTPSFGSAVAGCRTPLFKIF